MQIKNKSQLWTLRLFMVFFIYLSICNISNKISNANALEPSIIINIESDIQLDEYFEEFAMNGTRENPYIFENIEHTGSSSIFLSMKNTSKNVLFRNLTITNVQLDRDFERHCMLFQDLSHIRFENCQFLNSDAIRFINVTEIEIDNCQFYNSRTEALHFWVAENISVSNCYASNVQFFCGNQGGDLELTPNKDIYLWNNTIEGAEIAFYCIMSISMQIENNTLRNITNGLTISNCEYINISQNIFKNINNIGSDIRGSYNIKIDNCSILNTKNCINSYVSNITLSNSLLEYYENAIVSEYSTIIEENNIYRKIELPDDEKNILSYNIHILAGSTICGLILVVVISRKKFLYRLEKMN